VRAITRAACANVDVFHLIAATSGAFNLLGLVNGVALNDEQKKLLGELSKQF
jgi:hypothetical protein